MTLQEDYVLTVHPDYRSGVKMKRARYNEIIDFILHTLEHEKEITINRLIEKANYRFWDELKDETGWYVYHVKLDMEARGLIKNERCDKKKKTFIVRNNRSRVKRNGIHPIADVPERTSELLARKLRLKFVELFQHEPVLVNSPGVINLIGEHTEYNFGFAMQAAIDKSVQFAISPSANSYSSVYSMHANELQIIGEGEPENLPGEFRIFSNTIRHLKSKGHAIPAFDCVFFSDLPTTRTDASDGSIASGFVFSLNLLFDLKLSVLQMIRVAQLAKNGKQEQKLGIIDHFTSILSKEKHVLMLDCQRLTYNYCTLDLKEYCILVCDSTVRNASAQYILEERKAECAEGLDVLKKKYPSVNSLRDISIETLIDNISCLPLHILKRCQYVVQENERVHLAGKYLDVGKLKAFGQSIYKTHEGLSRLYEVSCPEVDFLVEQTKHVPGILGSRLMGEISGGCTLNIIHKSSVNSFTDELGSAYRSKFGLDLKTYVLNTSAGATLLSEQKII